MRFNDFTKLTEFGPVPPEQQIGAEPQQPQQIQQRPAAPAPVKPVPVNVDNDVPADIISDLDDLGQTAEENPEVSKKIESGLQALLKFAKTVTSQSGGTMPTNENSASFSLISELESQIEHIAKLGPKAESIIATIRKQVSSLKAVIEQDLAAAKQAGGEEVSKQYASAEASKKKMSAELASRLGKSNNWGRALIAALDHFENPQLTTDFLKVCAEGTALTVQIPKIPQVVRYKLSDIVHPSIKAIFDPANRAQFRALLNLPWTEGAGRGAGVGPGESLLACLIPGATQPAKGDLSVNGENWEVKAGSYTFNPQTNKKGVSNAWLDCSSNSDKAPVMKAAFVSALSNLKTKNQKKIQVKGNVLTLGEIINLADFRSKSLIYLQIVLQQLERFDLQYDAIAEAYSAIVPTVKAKKKSTFNKAVVDSVNAILNLDATTPKTLATIHVNLSMLEYGIGDYKSPNFIFYNSTTQDIAFSQGTSSISKATSGKDGIIPLYTFTMNGSGKASAGVFLSGGTDAEVDSILGFQRKRPAKTA